MAKSNARHELAGIIDAENGGGNAVEQRQNDPKNEPAATKTAVFPESTPPPEANSPPKVADDEETGEITITIPYRRGGKRYAQRHVETKLEPLVAADFACVLAALMESGAKMPSGRRVASTADAVRWVCGKISEKLNAN